MELHDARVLAFGTAGAQGSGLVDALTARGATPVRVSSRPGTVDTWRASGEQALLADLRRPETLEPRAGDAAVLHVPLSMGSPDGVGAVLGSVRRLLAAGLPVAVNTGTPVAPAGAPDPFGSRDTAQAFVSAGATVLTPTAYLENHAAPWALGPLARGELVYPRPATDPLAWITARDVTAAAVAALAADVGAQLLRLAGPEVLTFEELARELGAGLDRETVFRRVSAEEFGDLMRPFLGDEAAAGVAAAYGGMPEDPNPAMVLDASGAWRRLGVEPTSARTWAEEVLAPLLAAPRDAVA
jgi:uncharacterized protein YbjT (DUF2867 family)